MRDVTVCTTYYDDGKEPVLVASCKKWGIPLQTFGTKSKFEGFLKTKIIPIRDFLTTVKTKYVMFLDGNDTFLVAPLEKIMETYHAMVTHSVVPMASYQYVIGSELTNWPYEHCREALVARARATGTKSPLNFTDPGLVLGETEAVLEAFTTIADSVEGYAKRMPDARRKIIEDDVGLWVLNMLDGTVDPLVDYDCQLIVPLRNMEWEDYSFHKGRLHCHLTNSWPCIIHCNGHRALDRKTFRRAYSALVGKGKTKVYKLMRMPAEGKVKWGV